MPWYQLTTPYACGGIEVRNGKVVNTAPIFYKLLGQNIHKFPSTYKLEKLMTSNEEKIKQLKILKQECLNCSVCDICKSKALEQYDPHVFGCGNINPKLFFVGQNPGRDEIAQRKPFVGRAGHLLDKYIKYLGLTRKEVYITNIVKGYTPNNRQPELVEIQECGKRFLEKEIEIINPKIIVGLGNPVLIYFTGLGGITSMAGNLMEAEAGEKKRKMFFLYHPAYVLRNYTTSTKANVKEHLDCLKTLIKKYFPY